MAIDPMDESNYANIRDILDYLIGKRLVDITQHSLAEWKETGEAYVMFMFEDGSWVRFYLGDAEDGSYFDHQEG